MTISIACMLLDIHAKKLLNFGTSGERKLVTRCLMTSFLSGVVHAFMSVAKHLIIAQSAVGGLSNDICGKRA